MTCPQGWAVHRSRAMVGAGALVVLRTPAISLSDVPLARPTARPSSITSAGPRATQRLSNGRSVDQSSVPTRPQVVR